MMKVLIQKKENGYPFTPDKKNALLDNFNKGNFIQGSAILKVKYYNSPDIIFQNQLVKERVKEAEVNRIRNAFLIDTL